MYQYDRLKSLRREKKLNQSAIAELLDTTQQQYSKYEKGIQEIPAHHLITLARFYQISVDYILGLTDKR